MSLFSIFHDLSHTASQQSAQLVHGICGDTVPLLDTIESSPGKALLLQAVGSDPFSLHGLKKRFVTDHMTPHRWIYDQYKLRPRAWICMNIRVLTRGILAAIWPPVVFGSRSLGSRSAVTGDAARSDIRQHAAGIGEGQADIR